MKAGTLRVSIHSLLFYRCLSSLVSLFCDTGDYLLDFLFFLLVWLVMICAFLFLRRFGKSFDKRTVWTSQADESHLWALASL
jgi:hypothetical protein